MMGFRTFFFTTKKPGKGSGLGLAQVFGFAKQSGGGVTIETRVGEGTSVKVFLPRAEVVLSEPERESLDAAQGSADQSDAARILVVDDGMCGVDGCRELTADHFRHGKISQHEIDLQSACD
jgi:hypothetical protein